MYIVFVSYRRLIMTSKPNWACAGCGMYSSRRSSVKRHVQNIHGSGQIVSYMDYFIGRQAGFYLPRTFPSFEKKAEPEHAPSKLKSDAFQEGFWNEAGKDAYRKGADRLRPTGKM